MRGFLKALTELRQIDAIPMRLYVRVGAHVPEHRKHERHDRQEAKDQYPRNVEHVRNGHNFIFQFWNKIIV